MAVHRRPRALAALLVILVGSLIGCQAVAGPQATTLSECANPTPANRDWCLTRQFPSVE